MIRANMKRAEIGFWLAVLLLALALGLAGIGCANDQGEDALAAFFKQTPPEEFPPEKIPTVGLAVCTNCHTGQTDAWLTGAHGNLEAINHTTYVPLDLGLDSDGFPYYAYFTDNTCATCHDPLGDGYDLSADWTGNVPRPVVGCESCHGGGAEHYGIGPIAFPKPGHTRCGKCHNASFPKDHLAYHPNAANIVEDYEASPHSDSINDHALATALSAAPEDVRATCSRCHTDDGFQLYVASVPGTLGYDSIVASLDGLPALEGAFPIECRTCHNPHTADADDLTWLKSSVVSGNPQSAEFNQCTACHQLTNAAGAAITDAYHDPAVNSHGSEEEIIVDSHAAVPGDTRLNSGPTEKFLYFVKKGDDNACAACHNPHSADATINKQYARSGHGDALGDPWIHYDWKHSGRAACQRCHTTTGYMNFADSRINATVYNPAANDFSWLLTNENPRVDGNDQMQTIYCWGCHTDYKGGLRNPGAFNITAIELTYVRMDNSGITFPDVLGSNVCVLCHTGRVSGGTIQNTGASDGTYCDNDDSFSNSHYLTAGGVVFGEIGYEFPGRDYTNDPDFEHDQIGLPGAPARTGDQGPCVGCHMMNNPEIGVGDQKVSHLFEPLTKEGETITAVTTTTCAACHDGVAEEEMTPAVLNEEEELYQAGLEALNYRLHLIARGDGGTGFWWNSCNPYFFKTAADAAACTSANAVKSWWTVGDVSANCNGTAKPNMGAAYNLNMLEHDPGGFTHNRLYVRRLLYDSFDWIDNNVLDHTVKANLAALDPGTHPYRDLALEYLLSDPACAGAACRPGD